MNESFEDIVTRGSCPVCDSPPWGACGCALPRPSLADGNTPPTRFAILVEDPVSGTCAPLPVSIPLLALAIGVDEADFSAQVT